MLRVYGCKRPSSMEFAKKRDVFGVTLLLYVLVSIIHHSDFVNA